MTQASAGHAAGIANEGYWGIPVRPNTRYRASFYAKAAPGFTGPITAAIESEDGRTIYATRRVTGLTPAWKQYEVTLTTGKADADREGALRPDRRSSRHDLVQPGVAVPADLQGPGRTASGRTCMQMLVDMRPKFLRFPGGNYLEGDQIADRFEWKKTLGPLSERPGHMAPWGYRSTDGLGLHEFLLWAEDMNAEPCSPSTPATRSRART